VKGGAGGPTRALYATRYRRQCFSSSGPCRRSRRVLPSLACAARRSSSPSRRCCRCSAVPPPGSCAPQGSIEVEQWRQSSFSFDWPASLSMMAATSTVPLGADDGAADDAGGGVATGFAPCAAGAPAAVPDPGAAGFPADPRGAGAAWKKWCVTPSMISRLSNEALKSIVAPMSTAFLVESLKLGLDCAPGFCPRSSSRGANAGVQNQRANAVHHVTARPHAPQLAALQRDKSRPNDDRKRTCTRPWSGRDSRER
jgi:hypothetical protein